MQRQFLFLTVANHTLGRFCPESQPYLNEWPIPCLPIGIKIDLTFHFGFDLLFPVINDAEHLLLCLSAIYLSSLVKGVFEYFAHFCCAVCFLIDLLEFVMHSGHKSFILCFANIFYPYVACLLTFFTMSFKGQRFLIFMKSHLSMFFFHSLCFLSPKWSLPNSKSWRCFFYVFFCKF